MSKLYTEAESEYLQHNSDWHVGDSPWKAEQIVKILTKNKISPKTVVEIGCGAGEILNQLHLKLADKNIQFEGYDVAPDAYALAVKREKERLAVFQKDLLAEDKHYDLLLMMDVFEHVDDYIGFIRKSATKATYRIYHIPLDVHVSSILRGQLIPVRQSVGHLHYYTKETALATLEYAGEEIVDFAYTAGAWELEKNKRFKTMLANIPRRILYAISPDFAVRIFGGCSLIVLTK